jgi:putative membrane protein
MERRRFLSTLAVANLSPSILAKGQNVLADLTYGLVSFTAYFLGCLAYCAAFCFVYTRLTAHDEYELIVERHNASAAIAFGSSLLGFAIALAGAVHNTTSAVEFVVWGFVAFATQIVAYLLARFAHPTLSRAIEENAIAAAVWLGTVSVSAGVLSAACMSP